MNPLTSLGCAHNYHTPQPSHAFLIHRCNTKKWGTLEWKVNSIHVFIFWKFTVYVSISLNAELPNMPLVSNRQPCIIHPTQRILVQHLKSRKKISSISIVLGLQYSLRKWLNNTIYYLTLQDLLCTFIDSRCSSLTLNTSKVYIKGDEWHTWQLFEQHFWTLYYKILFEQFYQENRE